MSDLESLAQRDPALWRNGDTAEQSSRDQSSSLPTIAEAEASQPSVKISMRIKLRQATLHFTPSWFSVSMGTGISSLLLHQLPYQFNGLGIISNVVFGLTVVLFLVFLAFSVARYTIWPSMLPTMLFHETQSLFLGTFAIALGTIVNMCALSATPAWGGHFAIFTWVLWWIESAVALFLCIGMPFLQFTRHTQSLDKVTGVWFLPVVSSIVAAASGGIVATIVPEAHARLTIIVSYILWGTGFGFAFMIMSLYYARQAIHKIPSAALIVSAFLPLGPCGQGAYGLLKLASSLRTLSQKSGQALGGSATAQEAQMMAAAIYGVSIPIALVIWGVGLVWLVLAVSSLLDRLIVSDLDFNLGWWGFTFPLGAFALATIQLGSELGSGGFRILATVLALLEVLLWLCVAVKTTIETFQGKTIFSPCLAASGGEPPRHVPDARKYEYKERKSRSQSRARSQSQVEMTERSSSQARSQSRGRRQ